MSDLGTSLREYIDAAAMPITLDEVEGHPLVPEHRRPRRWLAVAAVLVLIVAAAAWFTTRTEPEQRIVTRPAPLAWLTPFGREQPMPDVPDGWKLIDYEGARFAVPRGWDVRDQCGRPRARSDDVVEIPTWTTVDAEFCPTGPGTPRVRLTMGDARRDLADPVSRYGFEARGPLAGEIRATLTDSGLRRALQEGPVADVTGWKVVSHRGIALRVPPSWPTLDLASAAGITFTNPPGCSYLRPTFDRGRRPMAFVDEPGGECLERPELDLHPGDGVWLRYAGGDPPRDRTYAEGRIGGLDVTIGDLEIHHDDQVVELIASNGDHWVSVSIGVGDVPVARAILRSLHRA